jgi:hypothetical protein
LSRRKKKKERRKEKEKEEREGACQNEIILHRSGDNLIKPIYSSSLEFLIK